MKIHHIIPTFILVAFALTMPAVSPAQSASNILYTLNTTYNSAYNINTYTITINADNIPDPAVVIPSFINGVPVTSIGNYATTLIGTSITIPDSVTNIGVGAFTSQTLVTNVIVGSGVRTIGDSAFTHCPALATIYFMGNAPSVGAYLFSGDTNATVYYLPFTTGWTNTFAGRPTMPWNPFVPPLGIASYSNQPVLFFPVPPIIGTNYEVQMSTNLASDNWVKVTSAVKIIGLQITNVPAGPVFFRLQ